MQTALGAAGCTMDHRGWGLAGIALFSVMMCTILISEMAVLKRDEALGMGDGARRFAAVTLCAWPLMAGLFTMAIANVRPPHVHKRFMSLLLISMFAPGTGPVFLTRFPPHGAVAP